MEGMDSEEWNVSATERSSDSCGARSLHPRSSPTVGKPKSESHLKRGDPAVDGPRENPEAPERTEVVSPDTARPGSLCAKNVVASMGEMRSVLDALDTASNGGRML